MRALWFCAALMPVLAQADIYRWTDAQGKVHFSATPRHATPRHRPARNASKSGRRWWNVTPRPASASSAPRSISMLVARNAPPPPNAPASARLRWPRNAGACGNSCPSSNAAAASIGRTPAAGRFT
ncbi:TPA: DUF4124 domain-containing protein [Pseudomonas aeruginosa]|nr:DUF4124 domain-containing protein [Pseudomonas aeruginosa]